MSSHQPSKLKPAEILVPLHHLDPSMPVALNIAMQGRTLIRRFDLESVVIDDSLTRFKDPQLVLKPELAPTPRKPLTGSKPSSQPAARRRVLMVHVKDRANELEKLYLDAFASSTGVADPSQPNSVTCSYSESSLLFRYWKGDNDNRHKTLMVRFRAKTDLGIVLDELKASGVEVDDGSTGGQGVTRMAVHPQLQHLVVVDQRSLAPPFPQSYQTPYYPGSPPPIISPGGLPSRYFTPPTSSPHYADMFRPPSQPLSHFWNTGVQPALPSWTPPPRPSTVSGIPGITGEGIYKVSRVRSGSSAQPRRRRLDTIPESSLSTASERVDRALARVASTSRKRSMDGDELRPSDTVDRRTQLAKALSTKYSSTASTTASSRVEGSEDTYHWEKLNFPAPTASGSNHPGTDSESSDMIQYRNNSDQDPPVMIGSGETTLHRSTFQRSASTASATPQIPRWIDRVGHATDKSSQSEIPRTRRMEKRDGWILQQFNMTHDVLTVASGIWDKLIEEGESKTKSIRQTREAQEIWGRGCEEWVRHLQDSVIATVQKLRESRRQDAGE